MTPVTDSSRSPAYDRLHRQEEDFDLVEPVDVAMLVQASMARLIPALGAARVPVLSSPRSGARPVKHALTEF